MQKESTVKRNSVGDEAERSIPYLSRKSHSSGDLRKKNKESEKEKNLASYHDCFWAAVTFMWLAGNPKVMKEASQMQV